MLHSLFWFPLVVYEYTSEILHNIVAGYCKLKQWPQRQITRPATIVQSNSLTVIDKMIWEIHTHVQL